jgi:hypothetical protein
VFRRSRGATLAIDLSHDHICETGRGRLNSLSVPNCFSRSNTTNIYQAQSKDIRTKEMSPDDNLAVDGNMYFLSRDEKYREEKPYTLRYTPDDGFPQTNIDRTEYSIRFHNMRTEQNLVYDRCGFRVANLQSQMKYEDYADEDRVESIHRPEVAECVKQAMKASSAEVLDYVVSYRSCLVDIPVASI